MSRDWFYQNRFVPHLRKACTMPWVENRCEKDYYIIWISGRLTSNPSTLMKNLIKIVMLIFMFFSKIKVILHRTRRIYMTFLKDGLTIWKSVANVSSAQGCTCMRHKRKCRTYTYCWGWSEVQYYDAMYTKFWSKFWSFYFLACDVKFFLVLLPVAWKKSVSCKSWKPGVHILQNMPPFVRTPV